MTPKETNVSAIHIVRSVMYALEERTPLTDFAGMLLRNLSVLQAELKWMAELPQASRASASLTVIPHVVSVLLHNGEQDASALVGTLNQNDAAATLRLCLGMPLLSPDKQRGYLQQKLSELEAARSARTSEQDEPRTQMEGPANSHGAANSQARDAAGTPGDKSGSTDETAAQPISEHTAQAPAGQTVTPLQAGFGQVSRARESAGRKKPVEADSTPTPAADHGPLPHGVQSTLKVAGKTVPTQQTAPHASNQQAPVKSPPTAVPATSAPTAPADAAPAAPASQTSAPSAAPSTEQRWSQKWDSGSWDTSPTRTQEQTWDLLEYIKYLSNNRMINTVAREINENHNTLNRILRDKNRAPKVLDRLHERLKTRMREWQATRGTALLTAPEQTAAARPATQQKTPAMVPAPVTALPISGADAERVALNVRALYRNQEGQTLLTSVLEDSRHFLGTNRIKQILRTGGLTARESDEVTRLNKEAHSMKLTPSLVQAALRVLMKPLPEEYGEYAHIYALPTAGRALHERRRSIRDDYTQLLTRTPMSREALEYAAQTEDITLPGNLLTRLFNDERVSPDELTLLKTLRGRLHNDRVQELREWSLERCGDSDHVNPINRAWFALAQEGLKNAGDLNEIRAQLDDHELNALNILMGVQPAPRGGLGVTPRMASRLLTLAQHQQMKNTNLWAR